MSAQALAALASANRIRLARAACKRELKALDRNEAMARVAAMLREPVDPPLAGMKLADLLGAIPRMGPHRIDTLLDRAGLQPARGQRPLNRLTTRELEAVACALETPRDRTPAVRARVCDLAAECLNGHWHSTRWFAEQIGYSVSGTGQALGVLEREGRAERLIDGKSYWRAAKERTP